MGMANVGTGCAYLAATKVFKTFGSVATESLLPPKNAHQNNALHNRQRKSWSLYTAPADTILQPDVYHSACTSAGPDCKIPRNATPKRAGAINLDDVAICSGGQVICLEGL